MWLAFIAGYYSISLLLAGTKLISDEAMAMLLLSFAGDGVDGQRGQDSGTEHWLSIGH